MAAHSLPDASLLPPQKQMALHKALTLWLTNTQQSVRTVTVQNSALLQDIVVLLRDEEISLDGFLDTYREFVAGGWGEGDADSATKPKSRASELFGCILILLLKHSVTQEAGMEKMGDFIAFLLKDWKTVNGGIDAIVQIFYMAWRYHPTEANVDEFLRYKNAILDLSEEAVESIGRQSIIVNESTAPSPSEQTTPLLLSLPMLSQLSKAFVEFVAAPSFSQRTRFKIYQLVLMLLKFYPNAMETIPSLVQSIIQKIENERDPRNLLIVFPIIETLGRQYNHLIEEALNHPYNLADTLMAYFPIHFTPPPNDPFGITEAQLRASFDRALISNRRLAPHVLEVLMDNMSLPDEDNHAATLKELLRILRCVLPIYGPLAALSMLPSLYDNAYAECLNTSPASCLPEMCAIWQYVLELLSTDIPFGYTPHWLSKEIPSFLSRLVNIYRTSVGAVRNAAHLFLVASADASSVIAEQLCELGILPILFDCLLICKRQCDMKTTFLTELQSIDAYNQERGVCDSEGVAMAAVNQTEAAISALLVFLEPTEGSVEIGIADRDTLFDLPLATAEAVVSKDKQMDRFEAVGVHLVFMCDVVSKIDRCKVTPGFESIVSHCLVHLLALMEGSGSHMVHLYPSIGCLVVRVVGYFAALLPCAMPSTRGLLVTVLWVFMRVLFEEDAIHEGGQWLALSNLQDKGILPLVTPIFGVVYKAWVESLPKLQWLSLWHTALETELRLRGSFESIMPLKDNSSLSNSLLEALQHLVSAHKACLSQWIVAFLMEGLSFKRLRSSALGEHPPPPILEVCSNSSTFLLWYRMKACLALTATLCIPPSYCTTPNSKDAVTLREEAAVTLREEAAVTLREEAAVTLREEAAVTLREEAAVTLREEAAVTLREEAAVTLREEAAVTLRDALEALLLKAMCKQVFIEVCMYLSSSCLRNEKAIRETDTYPSLIALCEAVFKACVGCVCSIIEGNRVGALLSSESNCLRVLSTLFTPETLFKMCIGLMDYLLRDASEHMFQESTLLSYALQFLYMYSLWFPSATVQAVLKALLSHFFVGITKLSLVSEEALSKALLPLPFFLALMHNSEVSSPTLKEINVWKETLLWFCMSLWFSLYEDAENVHSKYTALHTEKLGVNASGMTRGILTLLYPKEAQMAENVAVSIAPSLLNDAALMPNNDAVSSVKRVPLPLESFQNDAVVNSLSLQALSAVVRSGFSRLSRDLDNGVESGLVERRGKIRHGEVIKEASLELIAASMRQTEHLEVWLSYFELRLMHVEKALLAHNIFPLYPFNNGSVTAEQSFLMLSLSTGFAYVIKGVLQRGAFREGVNLLAAFYGSDSIVKSNPNTRTVLPVGTTAHPTLLPLPFVLHMLLPNVKDTLFMASKKKTETDGTATQLQAALPYSHYNNGKSILSSLIVQRLVYTVLPSLLEALVTQTISFFSTLCSVTLLLCALPFQEAIHSFEDAIKGCIVLGLPQLGGLFEDPLGSEPSAAPPTHMRVRRSTGGYPYEEWCNAEQALESLLHTVGVSLLYLLLQAFKFAQPKTYSAAQSTQNGVQSTQNGVQSTQNGVQSTQNAASLGLDASSSDYYSKEAILAQLFDTDAPAIIEALLTLSVSAPFPLVRLMALQCLTFYANQTHSVIAPFERKITTALRKALDDKRYAVRRAAGICRNEWASLLN